MSEEGASQTAPETAAFYGYAPPTSSTTYTPNQFFDVVLPNASRGCLRLVAYIIRKTLGWSDEHGNPQNPEAHVSYRELIEKAGISRGALKPAIDEALSKRYIDCIRFGQPHKAGEEGYSALYSLRWDEREEYITDESQFDGFFAGNGNLTHIPNQFFDLTVPSETLALVKVVGVIIRHTIGFQTKFGFRRQQVDMSFTDIQRRTGIGSRTTVSKCLVEAIERNHLRRVSEGNFDHSNPATAVYAVKWNDGTSEASFEPKTENGSKSGPGILPILKGSRKDTVQKVDQENGSKTGPANGSETGLGTVQEVDQERFKNWTPIEETTNLNNSSKQQQTSRSVVGGGDSLALSIGSLMAEGIEPGVAAKLASEFPAERIARQIEWLSERRITSSRTGFLIRCIERDIPREGSAKRPEKSPAAVLASHFVAELGGNSGEPLAEASVEDERQAMRLMQRAKVDSTSASGEKLGRGFGRYVQGKEQDKKSPVRSFSLAVRLYGDEYLTTLSTSERVVRKVDAQAARKEHEERFRSEYDRYTESFASEFSEDEEFLDQFEDEVDQRVRSRRKLSERAAQMIIDEMQDPAKRSRLIVEFAAKVGRLEIPSFWEWDRKENPQRFMEEAV